MTIKLKEIIKQYEKRIIHKEELLELTINIRNSILDLSFLLMNNEEHLKGIEFIGSDMIINFEKFKMYADPKNKNDIVTNQLFLGPYEDGIFSLLKLLLNEDSVFFDVGSNVGLHSIFAQSLNVSRVFAFEASPITYDQLVANIKLNDSESKGVIIPANYALSDSIKNIDFFYDLVHPAASSFVKLFENHTFKIVNVETKVIDKIEFQLDRLDLIKIDTEGSEYFVLKGANETINRFKPVIIVEMLRKWSAKYLYHPNDIINFLLVKGYYCFEINMLSLKKITEVTMETVATNFIFIHKDDEVSLNKVSFWGT